MTKKTMVNVSKPKGESAAESADSLFKIFDANDKKKQRSFQNNIKERDQYSSSQYSLVKFM